MGFDEPDPGGSFVYQGPGDCPQPGLRPREPKPADYVLSYKPGLPLAIVDAKDNNHTVCAGATALMGAIVVKLSSVIPK
jgi:hypothetical protein